MNIQVKYATLKDLRYKCSLYSSIIDEKGYSELQSRKYKDKIKGLIDIIDFEISNIESEAQETKSDSNTSNIKFEDIKMYRIEDSDVKEIYQGLLEISIAIFEQSMDIIPYLISRLEIDNNIIPSWILPTSTFKVVPEETRKILGDDYQLVQTFFNSNVDTNQINIDNFFIEKLMTNQRINKTLEFWRTHSNSSIKNRCPILEEAIYAHQKGKFFLSVSTLIPQVEGIMRDIIENNGRKADFGGMSDTEIRRAILSLRDAWITAQSGSEHLILLDNICQMISNLYIDDRDIPSHDELYRHGICHGRLINFGNIKNSLKLILIIDRLNFFI